VARIAITKEVRGRRGSRWVHCVLSVPDTGATALWSRRSGPIFSLYAALPNVTEGCWNQIAYEGQWAGHPSGKFQFTDEVFGQLIRNFRRREDQIPLTYGHPDGERGSFMGAAGWISDLRIGADDKGRRALFAKMHFTERAATQIRADEQRYCSVVVSFGARDEVTDDEVGAELLEVGLVLSAFLDGMRPLSAD
jgi:phage I-like protein